MYHINMYCRWLRRVTSTNFCCRWWIYWNKYILSNSLLNYCQDSVPFHPNIYFGSQHMIYGNSGTLEHCKRDLCLFTWITFIQMCIIDLKLQILLNFFKEEYPCPINNVQVFGCISERLSLTPKESSPAFFSFGRQLQLQLLCSHVRNKNVLLEIAKWVPLADLYYRTARSWEHAMSRLMIHSMHHIYQFHNDVTNGNICEQWRGALMFSLIYAWIKG